MNGPLDWPVAAVVDARDLLCPLPVLRARKVLAALVPGQVIKVLADDPAAALDMPHFAREAGHELLAVTAEGGVAVYWLRRGDGSGGVIPGQMN